MYLYYLHFYFYLIPIWSQEITSLQNSYPLSMHPLYQSVIWLALYHHITASLYYHISQSSDLLHHHISQLFDLPTATTLISHLTCPLQLCHCITTLPHYHITTLVSHLTCSLPPHQSVIWHALYHCVTFQTFELSGASTSCSSSNSTSTNCSSSTSSSASTSCNFSASASTTASASARELEIIEKFLCPLTSKCAKFKLFLPSYSGWVSPPPRKSPLLKLHSFLSKIMICRTLPPPKILGQKTTKQPLRWLQRATNYLFILTNIFSL